MPDLALERNLAATLADPSGARIIGLDEAGRGPWAGPVTAAAAWLDAARLPPALMERLDDSKRLSHKARETLFTALETAAAEGRLAFGLGRAEVTEIDERNILSASLAAMERAAADLAGRLGRLPEGALVDGNRLPALPCPARAVVGGDGLSLSIAAASILAKVTRDREMAALARRYPGYGWERNRGYGTAEHRAALARLGVTPQHRRSFRPVAEVMGQA